MDEVISALDSETEKSIQNSIELLKINFFWSARVVNYRE